MRGLLCGVSIDCGGICAWGNGICGADTMLMLGKWVGVLVGMFLFPFPNAAHECVLRGLADLLTFLFLAVAKLDRTLTHRMGVIKQQALLWGGHVVVSSDTKGKK